MTGNKTTRRNFLATSLAIAGGIIGSSACQQSASPPTAESSEHLVAASSQPPTAATPPAAMPQRTLGRTNITVPVLGLGGSASPLSRPGAERDAIAIIERALALGIRYFDTAANYGPSEERLGKVLPPQRSELLIASKTSARERDRAWRELETSLKRLQTDYLDLWQFHALSYDWDLDTILDANRGAIKAAQEAQEQGLVRFVGITGHHDPVVIAQGLRRYPFDTALIPINAADKHTPAPFINEVLPVAQKQNTGIIAMKVPAYGKLLKPGVLEDMGQAMGYALSQSGVHCCIIAAETVEQLEENVRVAQAFQPLASEELAAIEQRTAAVWQENSFFRDWA